MLVTKISIGKDVDLRRGKEMQVERKGYVCVCVCGVKQVGYGLRRLSRHDQRLSVANTYFLELLSEVALTV